MPEINFFAEEIDFTLPESRAIKDWITQVIADQGKSFEALNIIFTSDDYLHKINHQYLRHDNYTDIITFQYAESPVPIEGEIYISIDRVRENAAKYTTDFLNELHRVIVHGVLHLLGYKDHTELEKKEMRNYENHYLALRNH